MRIANLIIISATLALFCGPMPSYAKVISMQIEGKKVYVDIKFRDGNQIRATANVFRDTPMITPSQVALKAIATATREKGYSRFAIVKISDCGTMMMNGMSLYDTCRMIGQMLKPDELANAEKGHKIEYFNVEDIVK
jgi:hypothetical protein